MCKVIFSNKDSTDKSLYVCQNKDSLGCCYYLYLGQSQQEELTLSQTWNIDGSGCYFFLTNPPSSFENIIPSLKNYLSSLHNAKNYFLWIHDIHKPLSDNTVDYIIVNKSMTGNYIINEDTHFYFGNYIYFTLTCNCSIDLDSESGYTQFIISKSYGQLYFSTSTTVINTVIKDDVVYLPFIGLSRGCFRFNLSLKGNTDFLNDRISLKYCYHKNNILQYYNYPILTHNISSNISFKVSLDPIDQLNSSNRFRTYIAFDDSDLILPTNFITNMGHTIALKPHKNYLQDKNSMHKIPNDDSSLLVFGYTKKDEISDIFPCSILPKGNFEIIYDYKDTSHIHLMCGISGTETIACSPATSNNKGDYLVFFPNQPAYAPNFPLCSIQNNNEFPLLTNEYMTSWVGFHRSNPSLQPTIGYYAQPKGSYLYQVVDNPSLLEYVQVINTDLSKINNLYFPMVPYGDINSNKSLDKIYDFEEQIIAHYRKQIIEHNTVQAKTEIKQYLDDKENITKTITPQGLYVEINKDSTYKRIILAKNEKQDCSGIDTLEFVNLTPILKSAFQTSEQFLVISLNKQANNEYYIREFQNKISISGWDFNININENCEEINFNNILIFKFCKGSLIDKCNNPKTWTNALDFNNENSLHELSFWLKTYIQDGINQYNNGDNSFNNFNRIAQDKNWTGIIALKTNIDFNHFPEDLKGLECGINQQDFFAHHLGIDANHISYDDLSGLTVDPNSSLFALINYENKITPRIPKEDDYYFYVQTLKVLFNNSKIISFSSRVPLIINKLFGSMVTEIKNGKNIVPLNKIVFHGSYESHNNKPSYIFNCIEENNIYLDSNILALVQLTKGTFSIITTDTDSDTIISKFSFWGYLNFYPLSFNIADKVIPFDILSYGTKTNDSYTNGLGFSNFDIHMNFDIKNPKFKKFSCHLENMSFNIANSIYRNNSLHSHFPVKLTNMIWGMDNKHPKDKGYMNINTEIASIPLNNLWYGLEYKLELGSLGAIASNTGFYSNLCICFSSASKKQDKQYSIFIGLKIPGSTNNNNVCSIQGVFHVGIDKIQLTKTDNDIFLLLLNNIGIKFFGKNIVPGETDFYLFGNTDKKSNSNNLGWYLGYQCNEKEGGECAETKNNVLEY
jgi:hypothetical protein